MSPADATPPSDFQLPPEMTVAQATELAVKFLQDGHFEPAELLLKRVLEAAPDHPDALHFLGMLLCDLGRGSEGLPMVERSIALVPQLADWHNNFGIVCVHRDAFDAAEAAFRKALDLTDGKHGNAVFNLGITKRLQGDLDGAEQQYKQAIAMNPADGRVYSSYASLLAARGDYDGSVEQLELARAHDTAETARTLESLGVGYRRVRQFDKAAEIYRKWVSIEPDNAVPAYYLRALEAGANVPDRAPDDYVAQTFDSFAKSFDSVLSNLGYRAPQHLTEALKRARPAPDGSLDILDAGAGTGLCGPLIRPWAKHLVGVDLSERMLIRARDRDCYDTLEKAELTAFIAAHPDAYDIILSADTLVYFGDLDAVLAASFAALRPGGHLLFSVEHDDAGARDSGYLLQQHGRYAHSENYVRATLEKHGFAVDAVDPAILRKEGPEEVKGLIVTASRPV